ncbi:maleylpyruvate isomerase N-terminal domain-containing protein [Pseudactinotalea sp.]|uniref:maleylpyruvate isomerase N-terminal domain-containing protein n=1 Tax=Pseudactinotalea sp. TaxID=1926260 RepID=UPI003B3BC6B1
MPTLAMIVKDLREQWELLRGWLDELPDPASSEPSTLPGWSIADLVAHLGRVMDSISALRPAGPDDDGDPLSLSAYLATYATADAEYFDRLARELTASIANAPLDHLDRMAERAFADIEALTAAPDADQAVVVARRGPIELPDFLMSRLIELVVHGYDLAPTLPLPTPVDPTARRLVAQALIEVARQRTGEAIDVGDEAAWIATATGRLDWPSAVGRGAVRPSSLSDGTPDLTASLPLL